MFLWAATAQAVSPAMGGIFSGLFNLYWSFPTILERVQRVSTLDTQYYHSTTATLTES